MDIIKEIEWTFFGTYINGIRSTDTDALKIYIANLNAQVLQAQKDVAVANALLQDRTQALATCNSLLTTDSSTCQSKLAKAAADLVSANQQLAQAQANLQALNDSLAACKLGLDSIPLPQATLDLCNSYYSKYPEANITSNAHYIGAKNTPYYFPVQDWCTVGTGAHDFKMIASNSNAYVYNIVKKETNGNFHKACDLAVSRMISALNFTYAYDENQYGVPDEWAWAPDVEKTRLDDCDGGGTMRGVGVRTAGVPDILWRNACGNTRGSDEGHFTNYYLASDLKFHHINSTTNFQPGFDVLKTPLQNDGSDDMGLAYTWYSFNPDKSWSGFASTGAIGDHFPKHKDHRLLKKVKIVPKGAGGSP